MYAITITNVLHGGSHFYVKKTKNSDSFLQVIRNCFLISFQSGLMFLFKIFVQEYQEDDFLFWN